MIKKMALLICILLVQFCYGSSEQKLLWEDKAQITVNPLSLNNILIRADTLWKIGEFEIAASYYEKIMSERAKNTPCLDVFIAIAANRLGEYYHFHAVTRDFEKAKSFYLIASDFGHGLASNHLGRLFLNGEGVKRNEKKAQHYYELSCKQGYDLGCSNFRLIQR
jgi:TPR repeat protein